MVNPKTGNKAVKEISGAQTNPPSTLKSNNSQNMEDNGTDKYDTMIENVAPPSSNAINRVWKPKKPTLAATATKETTSASPQWESGKDEGW